MNVQPPIKIVTPYGGQLVWTMPGENLLFVHLKDMDKIRNRKRWSQVMYMYYLLNFRMGMFCKAEAVKQMEDINATRGSQGLNIQEINMLLGEEHAARADKTFILALDGDTDFLPISIRMLMQRMDVESVGATCGRIHPIGNGPMVWYQKFEYAVGHWLQKASEHVFGCVLCSPGCFSLFRARALMDANVIKRYTTEPTEPTHHLQYDQGEDRWLCTLLLQRGYRIEYAAGADAWTFAPEGFFEFFNQRRRWMPSTIANILDLLGSADRTRKENSNISLPYILYTWLLMLMTLLGPGTILMMMAGSFQLIFTLEITWAYFWSILPAAIFTLACFWLKTKWQLLMAAALSIGYGFIMVIVIVGTIITATTENIFHPSVIIMVGLLAIFMLTGLFHPKEASCLVHGILYILCIPSGYLLLVIYSICNLNDVSWGTREVPTKAQRLANEERARLKEQERLNKPKKSWYKKIFDSGETHITELNNLLRTILPKQAGQPNAGVEGLVANVPQDDNMLKILETIAENTRLTRDLLAGKMPEGVTSQPAQRQAASAVPSTSAGHSPTTNVSEQRQKASSAPSTSGVTGAEGKRKQEEDPAAPQWTKDEGLGKGQVIEANKEELKFWTGMIDKYLLPIRPTTADKKKIAEGLKDLRNSAAFAFILVNLLWMSLNFMFQLTEAAKVHLTYTFGNNKYEVEESVLGMSFVILLLLLLILQFVGMVIHRMGTLQQLLATTKIWGDSDDPNILRVADQDATMRNYMSALQVPVYDDVRTTNTPVPAEKDNPLGISVKASTRGFADYNDIAGPLNMLGSMVNAHRSNTLEDGADREALEETTRRLGGSQIRERIDAAVFGGGASFRPNLPPRKAGGVLGRKDSSKDKWKTRQGMFAMTAKELQKWRPGETIIGGDRGGGGGGVDGDAVGRANALWGTMGPLSRSLHMRASTFRQTRNEVDANWTNEDVAGGAQGRGQGQGRSRRLSPRSNSIQGRSAAGSSNDPRATTRM